MNIFKKKQTIQKDANFFVFFPDDKKAEAEAFGRSLKGEFVSIDFWLAELKDKKEWALRFNRTVSGIEEYQAIGKKLNILAADAGGDYDGSEIQV
jgi:hypothetical protein